MIRSLACVGLLCVATPLAAQDAGLPDALRVSWQDVAPHVEASRGDVVTVALGVADERRGPLAARRLWARREAEAHARAALHAWIDAAITHARLDGATIAALHQVVDDHAEVTATRARVDGSACVEVIVALRHLVAAAPSARGLPWSD